MGGYPAGSHAADAAACAALTCWDRDTCAAEHQIVVDPACARSTAARYIALNIPGATLEQVTISPADRVTLHAAATAPHIFAAVWGQGPVTLHSLSSATHRCG